jgi:glyoxylase-like metal-dependent hydrolase (beta-lactamase superfamily II)
MTLEGTNTYIVGTDPVHVIDPGPAIESHLEAIRSAAAGRGGIGGVLLTHSHSDHSDGAAALKAPLLDGREGLLEAIATPGHAADHVVFLRGDVCFCGDLVLGWGSAIVPPAASGGSLADYMASLERVQELEPALLCPGHGPWITDPTQKLAEYLAHRRKRERALVAALDAGERSPGALLDAAWGDVPEAMRPAAALAMQAHLEKLEAEGRLPAGFTVPGAD